MLTIFIDECLLIPESLILFNLIEDIAINDFYDLYIFGSTKKCYTNLELVAYSKNELPKHIFELLIFSFEDFYFEGYSSMVVKSQHQLQLELRKLLI